MTTLVCFYCSVLKTRESTKVAIDRYEQGEEASCDSV